VTQNERVKEVRKSRGLTLEKFGERLGVGKSAISKIENGQCAVSEQMAKAICREFNVDYIWLATGEGDPFIETDDSAMELIDQIMFGENEFHKNLFKTLTKLDEKELLALESILDKYIETTKE